MSNVWKEAALQLSEARNIFVFGYSLPETDSFFGYLFALGTASDTRIKTFWVLDPDSTDEVRARYEKLIGKGIQNRFDYYKIPFSQAIGELRRRLDANEGNSESLVFL